MKAELIPIDRLIVDPHNPRTEYTAEQHRRMTASVQTHGVQVPLIGYVVPEGIAIGDGHCRYEAARDAGLKELPVIVFPHKPSEAELLTIQLTINGHRNSLNPVDEYQAFSRLMRLRSWSLAELAEGLAVGNSEVTRVMAIGKLSQDELQLVREGKLSKSAAYALTRLSPEKRAAMVRRAAAGEVTRDELNSKARRKKAGEDGPKSRRVNCAVAGGSVSVQSIDGLDLPGLISLLEDLVRECRKARSQGLDISTAVRVLRDRQRSTAV